MIEKQKEQVRYFAEWLWPGFEVYVGLKYSVGPEGFNSLRAVAFAVPAGAPIPEIVHEIGSRAVAYAESAHEIGSRAVAYAQNDDERKGAAEREALVDLYGLVIGEVGAKFGNRVLVERRLRPEADAALRAPDGAA